MTPSDLPEKVVEYTLHEWELIRTTRPKLCEAVPDVPGLFVIERDQEGVAQTWLYGPYMLVLGSNTKDFVWGGYRYGILPGVYDLLEDVDGPLPEVLQRIRAVVAKSKDIKQFLAK